MEEKTINRDFRMECAQLIGEISSLAFMVNTFTKYCVFVDYSGHVDHIKVSVRAGKSNYNESVTEDQISIDAERWKEEKVTIEDLTILKSQLRKILLKKKVNYDGLRYTVREERDYHLIG